MRNNPSGRCFNSFKISSMGIRIYPGGKKSPICESRDGQKTNFYASHPDPISGSFAGSQFSGSGENKRLLWIFNGAASRERGPWFLYSTGEGGNPGISTWQGMGFQPNAGLPIGSRLFPLWHLCSWKKRGNRSDLSLGAPKRDWTYSMSLPNRWWPFSR